MSHIARKKTQVVIASLTLLLLLPLLPGLTGGARRPVQAQQDASLDVAITRIDHRHFPLVTVDIAVNGPDGSPVERLGSDNFRLFEDGEEDGEANEPVANASLVVEQNDAQPLDVILALDVHTSNERLAQIQAAAETFIEAVGERDEVALLSFHDEVQVIQRFTGNREILQTSLDGLTVQGTRTGLDDAVTEAVALANEHGASRTVVVVVTDGDNSTGTPEQTIARAQASGVSVYVVGIGAQIATDPLGDLAQKTGGQVYAAQGFHEIADRLQAIVWLLRQGYQVRYWSDIQPDDGTHDLTVRVAAPQGVGEDRGRIEALLNEVAIALVGLAEGQMVTGTINVSAEVSAPAPVASVTYLLDGQILGERDDPPYTFAWDTAGLSPGAHSLAAQAVDREGNVGTTRVSVQAPVPPAPPAPPPASAPVPAWQRYTMVTTLLVALGAVAVITLTGLGAALAWQRVRYRQVCQVRVENRGNVPSRYRLQAREPSGALDFQFTLSGPLPFAATEEVYAPEPAISGVRQPPPVRTVPRSQPGPRAQPQPRRQQRPQPGPQPGPKRAASSGSMDGARATAGWLMSVSRAIADMIGAVGALLPASMGQPLKNLSNQLRQQQAAASRLQRAPSQFASRTRRIPKHLARVHPPPTRGESPRAAAPGSTTEHRVGQDAGRETDWKTSQRQATSRGTRSDPGRPQQPQKPPVNKLEREGEWTLTPSVPPGESLPLDLIITPVGRPVQTQTYAFTVTTQSVEQASATSPAEESTAPVKTAEGHIQVLEVSWLQHTLAFFALAGLILIQLSLVGIILASTLSLFALGS